MNILQSLANDAMKKKQQLQQQAGRMVHQAGADLNPFDGPRVASPAPIQQPLHFSPVAQQRLIARNPTTAPGIIAHGPNMPSMAPTPQFNPIAALPGALKQGAQQLGLATGLGAVRAGIGLGQGFSGLADLATPGTGTSRVSKMLNNQAVNADQTAQANNVNAAYKIAQVPLNAATFLLPGGAATQAAVRIPKIGEGLNVASRVALPVANAVDRGANLISKGGAAGRIAAAGFHGALQPSNFLNVAGATAMQVGTESGKGQRITPSSTAASFGENLALGGALHAAPQAAVEAGHGLQVAGKAVNAATKEATGQTFAGLPKKQIIMDTRKLDLLHNAKQDLVTAHANPSLANDVNHGLRDLQQTHGLDFVTGSRGERLARIQQYLEQNGEAIPKLQAHQEKVAAVKNFAVDHPLGMTSGAVNDVGERIGMNGKPLKTTVAPAPTTKLVPPQPRAAEPAPRPAAKDTGAVSSAQDSGYAGEVKQTKFSKTVKNSSEVSPAVSKQVNAKYQSDTTQGALDRAQMTIKKQGLAKSLNQTLQELDSKTGTASRDTLARAIEVAKRHDALGTPASQAIAAKLYDKAAEHASAHGQSIQILAAIARRSPAGLRNKAFRDLKSAGIDVLKPENAGIAKEIQGHINAIGKLKDGAAKDMAIAVLQKAVAKHLPQSTTDKAVSVWKAGLLSGVKTQQGNAISNGTFGALKKISDVPAVVVDKALSLGTGKRTVALTGRGIASGTAQGAKSGVNTLKTGIDSRTLGNDGKYEQHAELNFNNKFLQKTVGNAANSIFRGMSAADQPFYYAALKNSLYDQAKADGLTKGLHFGELNDHMTKLATNPTEQMVTTATKEAEKAVLANDTVGSNIVSGIRKGIDNSVHLSPVGKKSAHVVINVLAPFTKVPSAFISRTIDFTPLGIPKTVISQVSHGKFDQRALSQAIGEATTGTGLIALGVALSQKNLVSGDYPKGDQKEAERWKAEGITPNSLKIGNKWVSMNYLGPVGLLFNAGHQIAVARQKGEGAMTQAFAAAGGLGQGLLGQSFLQGFSGFTNAVTDPQQSAKKYINSEAASIVPSIVNDAANVTDKFQRQANTAADSIKNRIPGLREGNAIKQDVYGNDLKQPAGQLNTLNGLKPSDSTTNKSPSIAEVNRLHTVNPNDKALQATPTPIGKSITVDKQNVKLTDKQAYDLQKQAGQRIQSDWNKLIQTPEYKAADDTQKVAMLNNAKGNSQEDIQRAYVVSNNLGTYSKPESAKAIAQSQGGDIASLASSKATGGNVSNIATKLDGNNKQFLTKYNAMSATDRTKAATTQNDFEYKYAQAKYQNDKANNKLTRAQDISAQQSVAKAKIGSSFSKDTRDVYGLSKPEVYDLITSDPNGKQIANDLLKYGDALQSAGVATNKFRTSKGVVRFSTASKTGSSGSASISKMLAAFKTPYSDLVKSSTKGAQLARSAGLAKRSSSKA